MSLKQFITGAATGAALCGSLCLVSHPARAGLIGGGTNTVNALFFLGSHSPADEEFEDVQTGPGTFVAGPVIIGAGGVDFVEGANDLSTIHVGDTAIAITNLAPTSLPFCTLASGPCPDSFTGFEFQFSSGVALTGVTVDPSSAAAFLPLAGGLTFSATNILLNIAGDGPSPGDQLILDLQFTPTGPTPTPEPATLSVLAMGIIGLSITRHRRLATPLRRHLAAARRLFPTRRTRPA
jgi:hypothetical protein